MFAARNRYCIFCVASTLIYTSSHNRDVVTKLVRKVLRDEANTKYFSCSILTPSWLPREFDRHSLRIYWIRRLMFCSDAILRWVWWSSVLQCCRGPRLCRTGPVCKKSSHFFQLRSALLWIQGSCFLHDHHTHIWYVPYIRFYHPLLIMANDVSHKNIITAWSPIMTYLLVVNLVMNFVIFGRDSPSNIYLWTSVLLHTPISDLNLGFW